MRIPGAVPSDPEALNPIAGDFTGDKHMEVTRIAQPLLELCQSMLEFPRDDLDTSNAIYIKEKTEAFLSGKVQVSFKIYIFFIICIYSFEKLLQYFFLMLNLILNFD